jgi:hypothetical protein
LQGCLRLVDLINLLALLSNRRKARFCFGFELRDPLVLACKRCLVPEFFSEPSQFAKAVDRSARLIAFNISLFISTTSEKGPCQTRANASL